MLLIDKILRMVFGDLYIGPAQGEIDFKLKNLRANHRANPRSQVMALATLGNEKRNLFTRIAPGTLVNNTFKPSVLWSLHKMSHLPEHARQTISQADKTLLKEILDHVVSMSQFWIKQIKDSNFWKQASNKSIELENLKGEIEVAGLKLIINPVESPSQINPAFGLFYLGKQIAEFEIESRNNQDRELASFHLCMDSNTHDRNPFAKIGLFFHEGTIIDNQIAYEENRNRGIHATVPVLAV